MKAAAQGNDLEQFSVFVSPLMDQLIIERHDANSELLAAYFDKTDFKHMMIQAIIKDLYTQLRAA